MTGPNLSFFTLVQLSSDVKYTEIRFPVYSNLDHSHFYGRPVDIIQVRRGLLGRIFEQTVSSANNSQSTELPYSLVKWINKKYKEREALGY